MSVDPSISLYVMSHKNVSYVDSNYIRPIQVGSALNSRIPNFIHDDEGDNISNLNKSFCEMTAQYWVWKNTTSDYVGFFHYRRYFSFKKYHKKVGPYCKTNDINSLMIDHNYSDKAIRKLIKKYDLIIPVPDDGIQCTNYQLYQKSHHIEDLEFVLNKISVKYPEMYSDALEYLNSEEGYYCNMFVMKKNIFDKYCEWVFDLLFDFEKSIDFSDYGVQDYRVTGYLGERLCGIYLYWLKKKATYKIKECPIVFVENTEPTIITKVFSNPDCVAVIAANEIYVPHLSALIQSIIENSSKNHTYDLVVLHTDISPASQNKLLHQINNSNMSLRFVQMTGYMRNYKKLPTHGHFKIETYYRFFMKDLMPEYDKVLYLDSDMIVLDDLSFLYSVDLTGYLAGACLDADTAGLYNGFEPAKKEYMDKKLRIQKPYEYFQAGTILFNLEELRKTYSTEEMLEFAMSEHWQLLDQDVLNYYFQGHVKFIDMKWNSMVDMYGIRIKEIISKAPDDLFDDYINAHSDPSIIHYAGPEKPWNSPDMDKAEYYWDYLSRTPFFENYIVQRNTQ